MDDTSRRSAILIASFSLLIAVQHPGFAQIDFLSRDCYIRNNWGTSEGLPSNESRAILQTRDGYIWIGTAFGITRFDGFRFESFPDQLPPQFKSSEVMSLLEDHDGTLWIGYYGKGILTYADGQFKEPRSCRPLRHAAVTCIFSDSLRNIYACTNLGLFSIRGDSGSYIRPLPENPEFGLVTADNTIYVYQSRIVRIAPNSPPRIVSTMNALGTTTRIFPETRTTLLVGSIEGFRRFRIAGTDTLIPETAYPIEFPNCYLPDNGSYLVGTRGKGILRFAEGRTSVPNDIAVPKGPAWVVHNMMRDAEGGIWVTTNAGVFRFSRTFFKILGEESGLPGVNTWLVHLSRDGALWVGNGRGGIVEIKQGHMRILLQRNGLPEDNVTEIYEASDGSVWFGGYKGGIVRMRNGVFEHMDRLPGYRGGKVYSITEDSSKKIWVGTRDGLHSLEGDRFIRHPVLNPNNETRVRAIVPGSNNDLWYAAEGFTRRLRNDTVTTFTAKNEPIYYGVFSILVDSGRVWYGTYGGGLYLVRGDSTTSLSGISSQFGPRILSIIEDHNGFLWLNAERELQRVRKADILNALEHKDHPVHVDIYNYLDGFENIEFNFSSANSTQLIDDGRILYASTAGVVVVDPSIADQTPAPPHMTIERIVADEVPFRPENAELPGGTRRVVVDFSALRFQSPAKIQFRYRLSGVDRDWVETDGFHRSVTYTNPGYGTFTFAVTARSKGGEWNGEVAGCTFTIAPRFYERSSTRIVGILGVIALLIIGYKVRTRRMRDRNKALELEISLRRKVEEQLTGSLEEKTVLLKEVHHRVKNNMQVISSLMSLQLGNSKEPIIQEVLRESQYRIRSMALVHETLYKSENFASVCFKEYLEKLIRQVSLANHKPNVTVRAEGQSLTLPIDQAIPAGLLMNELLTNAMKHAFPHDTPGTITVTTQKLTDSLVRISVTDTGKGLPTDFDITSTTSLGLRLVSSLASQLGGQVHAQSGQGSAFIVEFPIE